MKKVTPKDLALKKETVTSLSDANNEPVIYTDIEEVCKKTFHSRCMCISDNVQCESRVCNASETVGAVCCPLPTESNPGGACELTNPKDCGSGTVHVCRYTQDYGCAEKFTENGCELISGNNADDCMIIYSDADNTCYSDKICVYETKDCDE